MSTNSVSAIVVTYRPTAGHLENLRALRPYAQQLLVVDNGSPEELLAPFRAASEALDFRLIENGTNLGIAAALNIGVREALAGDCKWVLLFDQDSTVTSGFVEEMVAAYKSSADREQVAIVTPNHESRSSGKVREIFFDKDGSVLDPMTSGSLMPLSVFSECGLFEEDFIIDYVDIEYALRAHAKGYRAILADDAVLTHEVGAPGVHRVLGMISVASSNHSVGRQYYKTRNRLVVVERYWRQQPALCWSILKAVVTDTIRLGLSEEDRFKKLLMIARGAMDAFTGRMGMVVPL